MKKNNQSNSRLVLLKQYKNDRSQSKKSKTLTVHQLSLPYINSNSNGNMGADSKINKKYQQAKNKLQMLTKRRSKKEKSLIYNRLQKSNSLTKSIQSAVKSPKKVGVQNKQDRHPKLKRKIRASVEDKQNQIRNRHIINKNRLSKGKQQQKDQMQHKLKLLFNHIQNRLKTTNNNEYYPRQYQSQIYSLLTSSSQIVNMSQTSKSVLVSPRYQYLFQSKQKANKCLNSMIANIGTQMQRLEQIQVRNENSMKKYVNQQIDLMNLQLYKSRFSKKQTI